MNPFNVMNTFRVEPFENRWCVRHASGIAVSVDRTKEQAVKSQIWYTELFAELRTGKTLDELSKFGNPSYVDAILRIWADRGWIEAVVDTGKVFYRHLGTQAQRGPKPTFYVLLPLVDQYEVHTISHLDDIREILVRHEESDNPPALFRTRLPNCQYKVFTRGELVAVTDCFDIVNSYLNRSACYSYAFND